MNAVTDSAAPSTWPALALEPNLRRLRAFAAVAESGSIAGATRRLHRTQSVVTRAILELEAELGVALFERSRQGMLPTDFGRRLEERVRRALVQLETAERELSGRGKGLTQAVSHRQLQALIAIADHQSDSRAARRLDLTQPAVNRSLRELEQRLGTPLFYRTSRGMVPTAAGDTLVRRAKLAFAEIAHARDDIAEQLGRVRGRVTIGTLPLSGTLLVPRAINRLLAGHPELQVAIVEGTYDALLASLRCGDVDMIVGALRVPPPVNDIAQETLFEDSLSVVARCDHPLARKRRMKLSDLAGAQWIVPRPETPARSRLEQSFAAAGLAPPEGAVESGSLVTVRALLLESDRLAAVSRQQIRFEEESGLLAVLPIELPGTARPIGITTRCDAAPSPGARALLHQLREVSGELVRASRGRRRPL